MANVTPPPRVPFQARRLMYSIPKSGGGRLPRVGGEGEGGGGGGGRNPLATETQLEPYSQPGMWFNDIGNQKKLERNQGRIDQADAAKQAKVQAGVDAYQSALEKTGDPKAALAQTFHTDSEGHVHFADPQTFGAIMQMHQAAMQGGGQQQGQFQSVDLGHGLVGVADPSGRYSVHTAHEAQAAGQKLQRGPGGQYGHYNPDTNDFTPATVGGQQQQVPGKPPGKLNPQERTELNDLDTVMQQLGTLQQNVGATGLLTGHLQRFTAQHTELSPTQAAAYNRAYDQMAPALLRLERVPGQSKLVAQQAMQMLPHPGQADAYNLAQVIPGLQQQMRQHIANTYDSWHAEGKDTTVVQKLAMSYDAGPNYMARLRDAYQMLQSNAGNLNETQMRDLEDEQLHDRLTYDQSLRVTRQRIARGMMDPAEFDKAVAAHPELAQISDSERTAPQYVRQWNPPVAPMPNAAQPGQATIASPGAPPGRPMYPHGAPQGDQRTDPMAAKLAGQSSPQAQLPSQIQEPQLQQALPAANAMSPTAPTAAVQPAQNPLAPDAAEMQRQQQNQELLQQTQQLLQQTGMPGNPNMPTD